MLHLFESSPGLIFSRISLTLVDFYATQPSAAGKDSCYLRVEFYLNLIQITVSNYFWLLRALEFEMS